MTTTTLPDDADYVYDEFSMLGDNCIEVGLAVPEDVVVKRVYFALQRAGSSGRSLSALRWGTGPVKLVFIHGAAQNAHTWDTVVLALATSHGIHDVLCIDLPGHGHSDWRDDHRYDPASMAEDLVEVITALAPAAIAVVGMSLGGMTSLALADTHPNLVAKLVMVDVTPGVNAMKAKAVTDFVRGPQSFDSFDSLLTRTKEHNATRTESSLRRGILHNAHQNANGTWSWNYDRGLSEALPPATDLPAETKAADGEFIERFSPLWDAYERLAMPLLVVRGALSPIVDDADIAEVLRRRPDAAVVVVNNAGHSIQGDQPIELANQLAHWLQQ